VQVHSLPIFVRLHGRAVILLGEGAAADAKRRLLDRAGARIVGENSEATLAIVADGDEAACARLKARGVLVNMVDRPELCDFTLPAIVDRDPVLIAIGTGGVSAGLAAALRQRLEALLPAALGRVADALQAARGRLRERYPDGGERRRAIGAMLGEGRVLDPLADHDDPQVVLDAVPEPRRITLAIASPYPDELTLRAARLLGAADRIVHPANFPPAILDRARADAERIVGEPPLGDLPGLTLILS
jgi:uroporphyrin-III C-methyltransferase / precorrin-2 dehydrogenase / sirohydrochlorin ferrochelatase